MLSGEGEACFTRSHCRMPERAREYNTDADPRAQRNVTALPINIFSPGSLWPDSWDTRTGHGNILRRLRQSHERKRRTVRLTG